MMHYHIFLIRQVSHNVISYSVDEDPREALEVGAGGVQREVFEVILRPSFVIQGGKDAMEKGMVRRQTSPKVSLSF
jgi:hypothetical protein